MTYDEIKYKIFDVIEPYSRTIKMAYLTKLSKEEQVPYEQVLKDFNDYTLWVYQEQLKGDD